jgi:hypothetical protein
MIWLEDFLLDKQPLSQEIVDKVKRFLESHPAVTLEEVFREFGC